MVDGFQRENPVIIGFITVTMDRPAARSVMALVPDSDMAPFWQ